MAATAAVAAAVEAAGISRGSLMRQLQLVLCAAMVFCSALLTGCTAPAVQPIPHDSELGRYGGGGTGM